MDLTGESSCPFGTKNSKNKINQFRRSVYGSLNCNGEFNDDPYYVNKANFLKRVKGLALGNDDALYELKITWSMKYADLYVLPFPTKNISWIPIGSHI